MTKPINDKCKDTLEWLRERIASVQEAFHGNTTESTGHDPGDEDPKAWSKDE